MQNDFWTVKKGTNFVMLLWKLEKKKNHDLHVKYARYFLYIMVCCVRSKFSPVDTLNSGSLQTVFSVKSLVPNIEYRIWNIEYRISNIEYRISNIEYRISNIEYRISNIEYRISNIEYRISNIEYRISNSNKVATGSVFMDSRATCIC